MSTVESHLRFVEAGMVMSDCNVGEKILNFMMKPILSLYAGVNLSKIFSEEK